MNGFNQVVKKTIRFMVILWLIGSLALWLGGMTDRLIGFQIGSIVGVIFCLSLVFRLKTITEQDEKSAVRDMQINTMSRVGLTFLALLLSSKISFEAFYGCVIAIVIMFLGRFVAIYYESRLR